MTLSQGKAALHWFYRWKKHKWLLFTKHVKTECPFWHACSPCCPPLCLSLSFSELAPWYFPSAALTEPCFKSRHLR